MNLGTSYTELKKAYTAGINTLTTMIMDIEQRKLYTIGQTACGSKEEECIMYQIYLYCYALESWCCDDSVDNFISEEQLYDILAALENLQRECCDAGYVSSAVALAPVKPLGLNMTYIQNDPDNPQTIAGLVNGTTGVYNWYTVPTGGTASSTAPDLPDTVCGVYTFYVSQVNAAGESSRAIVIVTIIPPTPTTTDIHTCIGTVLDPLTVGGIGGGNTVQWYLAGSPVSTPIVPSTATAGTLVYTVTQTSNSQVSNAATLNVIVYPATPPVISGGQATTCIGSTFQMVAEDDGVWSSSDEDVLTVDEDGLVTAIAVGTANVEYTLATEAECASETATFAVTVQTTPEAAGTISGPASFAAGGTYTLTVPAIAGATSYAWELPTGWTGASITNSIEVTAPDPVTLTQYRFTVQGVNSNGCTGTKSVLLLDQGECPNGYTLSDDGTYCSRVIAEDNEYVEMCIVSSTSLKYGKDILRFYNKPDRVPSLPIPSAVIDNGIATPEFVDLEMSSHPWLTDNAMANATGIWLDADCNTVKDLSPAGATLPLPFVYENTGVKKTAYIVCWAENGFQIKHNSVMIADTHFGPAGSAANWAYLHAFAIDLVNGLNIINMIAKGGGGSKNACGMMILENTRAELEAAGAIPDSLNILYNSKDLIGVTPFIYSECGPGYVLDTSSGTAVCKRILVTDPI